MPACWVMVADPKRWKQHGTQDQRGKHNMMHGHIRTLHAHRNGCPHVPHAIADDALHNEWLHICSLVIWFQLQLDFKEGGLAARRTAFGTYAKGF